MTPIRLLAPRDQAPVPDAPFYEWQAHDGGLWSQFFRTDSGYLLRFRDTADFQVSADGHDIQCHPTPRPADDATRRLSSNQVRLLAASRQGRIVLHASAVAFGDAGVAFLGSSGAGKSTLAASLSCNGHPLLADDGLVLQTGAHDDGYYTLSPSESMVRLWDDSELALWPSGAPRVGPPVPPGNARFIRCTDSPAQPVPCERPRPLRTMYFLGDAKAPSATIVPMTKAEALVGLTRASFMLDPGDPAQAGAHFCRMSLLAAAVPAYRLDYPRRFELLHTVRAALIGKQPACRTS